MIEEEVDEPALVADERPPDLFPALFEKNESGQLFAHKRGIDLILLSELRTLRHVDFAEAQIVQSVAGKRDGETGERGQDGTYRWESSAKQEAKSTETGFHAAYISMSHTTRLSRASSCSNSLARK